MKFWQNLQEKKWEKRVLEQLKGDKAALERLLQGRAKRTPGRQSRAQLLEAVYNDYLKDQR